MEIMYCEKWWLQKKKPLDILTLNEAEERESLVDVSCNWDKFPDFGKYSNLIVEERK